MSKYIIHCDTKQAIDKAVVLFKHMELNYHIITDDIDSSARVYAAKSKAVGSAAFKRTSFFNEVDIYQLNSLCLSAIAKENLKKKLATAFDPVKTNNYMLGAEHIKEMERSETIKDLDRQIEKKVVMATASQQANEKVIGGVREELVKLEADVKRCFDSIIGNIDKLKDVL